MRAVYRVLHQENADYQSNNWLLDDLALLARHGTDSVLELGTGNGRFATAAAAQFTRVAALDWVESPVMRARALPANLTYLIQDALDGDLPRVGLVASADFLEDLFPHEIPVIITRMAAAGPRQFHTIACYQDSRGLHLTMRDPAFWLSAFRAVDPAFSVVRSVQRRGRADQPVVTIGRGISFP
jgi:SAM-dependent methyltransferase